MLVETHFLEYSEVKKTVSTGDDECQGWWLHLETGYQAEWPRVKATLPPDTDRWKLGGFQTPENGTKNDALVAVSTSFLKIRYR